MLCLCLSLMKLTGEPNGDKKNKRRHDAYDLGAPVRSPSGAPKRPQLASG